VCLDWLESKLVLKVQKLKNSVAVYNLSRVCGGSIELDNEVNGSFNYKRVNLSKNRLQAKT